MRFLADMGVATSTVQELAGAGHDAVHLRHLGLQRLPDNEILAKARGERRIVLTFDLDFGDLLALGMPGGNRRRLLRDEGLTRFVSSPACPLWLKILVLLASWRFNYCSCFSRRASASIGGDLRRFALPIYASQARRVATRVVAVKQWEGRLLHEDQAAPGHRSRIHRRSLPARRREWEYRQRP
jgi:hypothetical protein